MVELQSETPTISDPVAKLNAKIAAQALRLELEKHFVPGTTFESFKQSLVEHVRSLVSAELSAVKNEVGEMLMQHINQSNAAIGDLLHKHLDTLRAEHPTAAAVLEFIGRGGTIEETPEPHAAALAPPATLEPAAEAPPTPPAPEWLPPLDGEFPSLEAFVAMGFYGDTYEHQRAAWELKKATPTPETTDENGSSVPATGASSEIR